MQTLDEKWMRIAIEEANLAMKENEVPVGAVLVRNNKPGERVTPIPIADLDIREQCPLCFKTYCYICNNLSIKIF